MAMYYLYFFSYEDVSDERKRAYHRGKNALIVEDFNGYVIYLEQKTYICEREREPPELINRQQ